MIRFSALLFTFCFWDIAAVKRSQCGIDNSKSNSIDEGPGKVQTYPWFGMLFYPFVHQRLTTAVVLITKQFVLGSAMEIDRIPKQEFRRRARVVVGFSCNGPSIGVRDYTYHDEYSATRITALTIIQLETDLTRLELRPICPPPSYFDNLQLYAFVPADDCNNSTIMIYKMEYVPANECKTFYRRSDLDIGSMWPTHTACAKSPAKRWCIWRSGAILVVKMEDRWRLLGIGMYGPGCGAPARFVDYGMYHKWIVTTSRTVGRAAITRIADNFLILRRSASRLSRYGPCDPEETGLQIYTDTTTINRETEHSTGTIYYNLTLVEDIEYSCLVLKANYEGNQINPPKIRIHRWHSEQGGYCYAFDNMAAHFHITVDYIQVLSFTLNAYGQRAKSVDPHKGTKYANRFLLKPSLAWAKRASIDDITYDIFWVGYLHRNAYWFPEFILFA